MTLTDHYEDADYAFLFASPSSGEYFNATKGYLELDICENKTVHDVDDLGRPAEATHEETTLLGTDEIRVISEAIHANGGKVISNINFTLAWMVGNVERYSDALLAGFDTFPEATIDIITGAYTPSGKCRSPFQKMTVFSLSMPTVSAYLATTYRDMTKTSICRKK